MSYQNQQHRFYQQLRLICFLTIFVTGWWSSHVQGAPASDPTHAWNLPTSTVSRVFAEKAITASSNSQVSPTSYQVSSILEARGGGLIPAGYNPLGYKITPLGERFLEFGTTCLESDVGRFLASMKQRKTMFTIQAQWLEIVRVSKKGQSMRIYRSLQDLIDFCLAARLID